MATRVLSVAEKPSVAKELTKILSNGRFQTVREASLRNFRSACLFVGRSVNAIAHTQSCHLQRKGKSKYNMIFEFDYEINGRPCSMAVTSVRGHMMETEFEPPYNSWNACDPSTLLDLECPVMKFVRDVCT